MLIKWHGIRLWPPVKSVQCEISTKKQDAGYYPKDKESAELELVDRCSPLLLSIGTGGAGCRWWCLLPSLNALSDSWKRGTGAGLKELGVRIRRIRMRIKLHKVKRFFVSFGHCAAYLAWETLMIWKGFDGKRETNRHIVRERVRQRDKHKDRDI